MDDANGFSILSNVSASDYSDSDQGDAEPASSDAAEDILKAIDGIGSWAESDTGDALDTSSKIYFMQDVEKSLEKEARKGERSASAGTAERSLNGTSSNPDEQQMNSRRSHVTPPRPGYASGHMHGRFEREREQQAVRSAPPRRPSPFEQQSNLNQSSRQNLHNWPRRSGTAEMQLNFSCIGACEFQHVCILSS